MCSTTITIDWNSKFGPVKVIETSKEASDLDHKRHIDMVFAKLTKVLFTTSSRTLLTKRLFNYSSISTLKPAFQTSLINKNQIEFNKLNRKSYSTNQMTQVINLNKKDIESLISKDNKEEYVLIDVREDSELLDGIIPTAKHIPVKQTMNAFNLSNEDFKETYGFDKPSSSTKLVFYCKAGIRGDMGAKNAIKAGYTNVYNYPGSWLDWSSK